MIDLLFLVFFLASPQYYNYWVYFFPLLFSVFHYVYVPQVRQPKWVAWNLASRTFSPLGSSVYSIKWMHATYLAISVHETCKNVTSKTTSLLGLAKTGEIHGLWQEARTCMTCTLTASCKYPDSQICRVCFLSPVGKEENFFLLTTKLMEDYSTGRALKSQEESRT